MNRRTALRALSLAPAIRLLVPRMLSAQQAHQAIHKGTAKTLKEYVPRFFPVHQYATLRSLCATIIPADATSGGALEAKAPELIDLLASENEDYQARLGGGLVWLDSHCHDYFEKDYLSCSSDQQKHVLDLIAYRESAIGAPRLAPGIAFFTFLRDLTLAGYFTSETGMKYLGYKGNHFRTGFPGCPPG
jgi:gluconate 2-dehydrogenase gamma chain